MKKNFIYILIIFTCGMITFGCQRQKTSVKVSSDITPEELSESANITKLSTSNDLNKGSMLARVNDTIITRTEVEREMDTLFQQFQHMASPEKTNEFNSKLWKQALENVINRKLLFQQAERENVHPDKDTIDIRIKEIIKRFSSHKKYKRQLAHLGISEEKLRQEIEYDLKIKILLDNNIPPVEEVSQEEINEFYYTNSENFKVPERVRASHILIATSSEDSPEKREEKRQKLYLLKTEIENGTDFALLAQKHSDCNSKSKGGDLGFFERGKMVKPFEDAVFNLKINEISEIVETIYGYHLIKLTEHQEAKIIPFEQVQNKIVSFLRRQKRDLSIRDYLLKLRNNANIEYLEDCKP